MGDYNLTHVRVEAARALLADESLTVWACAELAGFTSPSGFEETYRRLCDETPTQTRARLAVKSEPPLATPAPEVMAPWRRLLTLQDPPDGIAAACHALRVRGREALRARASGVASWEQLLAEEWWETMRTRPKAELWVVLEERLETGAACEMLCRASREEGRSDRRRGLELAQAAVESLALLRSRLDPCRLAELEIRGLAELGNAHRLLRDFSAAEWAFAAAGLRVEGHPGVGPGVRGHLFLHKAALYAAERRFAQALSLTDRALVLAEGACVLRAEILVLQGCLLHDLGQIKQAIIAFKTCFELLSPEAEPFLAWVVLQNLALAHHKNGDETAARGWLERAEPIVRALGQPRPLCLRDWLVGLLARNQGDFAEAELHLRRAHAGYERLEDVAHAAVLGLDLAALYLRLGRGLEAVAMVTDALPQLDSLGLAAEGLVALSLLHQALETEAINTAVLDQVRAAIAKSVGAPEFASTKPG